MKQKIELAATTIVLIALLSVFATANDYMAVQGSVNFTGIGNITFTIWNQSTSGSSVYNSGTDYNGAISNGRYDILIGDGANQLSLEYGRTYYLDISINGQDLDFNGNERQMFQSNTGNITSLTIAANSIPKSRISSSSTWTENEIPTLTSSWSGSINASKIVSQLLLNVNSSTYLGSYTSSDLLGFDATLGTRIDSLNLTKSGIGTCAAGQFVNQTTATGVLCQSPGAATDMNNYTNAISINGNVITISRIGMIDLSATLQNNIISLDAQYNLSNKIGLANALTLDSVNITNKAGLANTHTIDANNITNPAGLNNEITLDALNITSGTFANSRIGTGSINNNSLNITNQGTTGQILSYASNGQMTWADDGDIRWTNTTTSINTDFDITTSAGIYQNNIPVAHMNTWLCDFLPAYSTTSCYPNYLGVVTGTGGIAAALTTQDPRLFGAYTISRGTAAASGYRWTTDVTAFRIRGYNESVSALINITQFPTGTNASLGILGFCDATTITTVCTDGVWFNITGSSSRMQIRGHNRANGAISSTPSNYNVTPGRFYIYKVVVYNSTQSNFYIYDFDSNGDLVWNDNATGNLPTGTSRETGSMFSFGESLAGVAGIRVQYDYILTEGGRAGRFK